MEKLSSNVTKRANRSVRLIVYGLCILAGIIVMAVVIVNAVEEINSIASETNCWP